MCMYTFVCIYMCIYKQCIYTCFVWMCPAGNTSSLSLLVVPGNREQQQPHLSQAVGYGMIYFPLTHTYADIYVSFIYIYTLILFVCAGM